MDTKLPKIPDFKPSDSTNTKTLGSKSKVSRRAKLSIITTGLLLLLVSLSFFIGQPIKIAKKAFTGAESRGADYNKDQYGLVCPAGSVWNVPEADKQLCGSDMLCGEVCPADRQTGVKNPEGHECCKVDSTTTETAPQPTIEPKITVTPVNSPTTSAQTSPCVTPPKVSGVTVFCPSCPK
jgi:hypothetical protein